MICVLHLNNNVKLYIFRVFFSTSLDLSVIVSFGLHTTLNLILVLFSPE